MPDGSARMRLRRALRETWLLVSVVIAVLGLLVGTSRTASARLLDGGEQPESEAAVVDVPPDPDGSGPVPLSSSTFEDGFEDEDDDEMQRTGDGACVLPSHARPPISVGKPTGPRCPSRDGSRVGHRQPVLDPPRA